MRTRGADAGRDEQQKTAPARLFSRRAGALREYDARHGDRVSRRGHYGFERRRRQDLQKAKQEAKKQRKTERAESGASGPEMGEAQDTGAQPGVWEWFSPSRGRTVTSPAGLRPDAGAPDDWTLLTDVEPDTEPE